MIISQKTKLLKEVLPKFPPGITPQMFTNVLKTSFFLSFLAGKLWPKARKVAFRITAANPKSFIPLEEFVFSLAVWRI